MHTALGAVHGAAMGGDGGAIAGVLGGAIGEIMPNILDEHMSGGQGINGPSSNSQPLTREEYNQRQIDHALRQAKISAITSMTAATTSFLIGGSANQINLANSTASSVVENNYNLHQIKAIQLMELAGEVPIGTTAAAMEQSAQAIMQVIDIGSDLYTLATTGPQGVAAKKVAVETIKQGIKKGAEKLFKKITTKINKVEKIDTPVGGKIIEHAHMPAKTTKATKAINNIPNKAENLPTVVSEAKLSSGKGINGPGEINSVLLPNEGKVGTYGELIKISKGDNLSAHHMPLTQFMESKGITKNQGISILIQDPKKGGRHKAFHRVLQRQDINLNARDALAQTYLIYRKVYKDENLYNDIIKNSMKELIDKNKQTFPELFKK